MSVATVETVADELTTNLLAGDGTYPWAANQTVPDEGYVLAVKGRGLKLRSADAGSARRWVARALEWIYSQSNPWAFYLGSWVDSATGEVYLDVSTVIKTREVAVLFARATGELAVWDLAARDEVRV